MMIELSFSITQQDIEAYAAVSGDHNPIHLDENEAKKHGFSGKIAHGMLTMAKIWSVLSGSLLAPNDFPEKYELAFLSPVYAGDLVILRIEPQSGRYDVEGYCNGQAVVKGFIYLEALKKTPPYDEIK